MAGKLFDWLDHRTGYRKFMDRMLLEHIPGGARWRYVWGSALAFVFMIQVVTGIMLMWAYSPGDTTAWGSVYFIQYEMDFGWLIRGLHHFGSQTMVVLLAIHMLQVVIAGAHLPPREFNWWFGLGLMGIILGLSLTGYLLPWDQKGYFATQVATNILGGVPVIGPFLQKVLVGGPTYGNHTLTHFYTLHVGILPPLLVVLLVMHIAVFRRHGITAPKFYPGEGTLNRPAAAIRDAILGGLVFATCMTLHVNLVTSLLIGGVFWFFALSRFFIAPVEHAYFWPSQVFRDLIVCLFIFAIMTSLVLVGGHGNSIDAPAAAAGEEPTLYERWAKAGREGLGANLDAPADPETESYPARPEWYFLFLFQLLKYFKGETVLIGTLVIPNGVMVLLFLLPFFGYGRLRKFGHFLGIVVVVVLLLAVGLLTILALADDSPEPYPFGLGGGTEQAKLLEKKFEHAAVEAKRAVNLAAKGIPEEGARQLLRGDPVTKGPKLFEMNCGVCHTYTSSPQQAYHTENKGPFKASDLSGWGTEKWILGVLDNPSDPKYFGLTKLEGMKTWRARVQSEREEWIKEDPVGGKKKIAEQEANFDLIARWLAQQKISDRKQRDIELEKACSKAFFDKKGANCRSCHTAEKYFEKVVDDTTQKKAWVYDVEGGSDGPSFVDYGGADWIRFMMMSPTHPTRYSKDNFMPAFRNIEGPGSEVHKQEFFDANPNTPLFHLSDIDREIIIRWMTRDDRVVFGGKSITAPPK